MVRIRYLLFSLVCFAIVNALPAQITAKLMAPELICDEFQNDDLIFRGCYTEKNGERTMQGIWVYENTDGIKQREIEYADGIALNDYVYDEKGRLKFHKHYTHNDTIRVTQYRKNGKPRFVMNYFEFVNGESTHLTIEGIASGGARRDSSFYHNGQRQYFARYRSNGSIEREISVDNQRGVRTIRAFKSNGKMRFEDKEFRKQHEKGHYTWHNPDKKLRHYYPTILTTTLTTLVVVLLL